MLNKMADISLIQDACTDDCDEGVYEQGDCLSASPTNDDSLPPLIRIQKYAKSDNAYDRQMAYRILQEMFRTAPPQSLSMDIASIMAIIKQIGEEDDLMVRADLFEQIPHMASQALKYSDRVEGLDTLTGEYLLPLVVRHLGCSDNSVDKAANGCLMHLVEQGLISKQQAEIQACPAILALISEHQVKETHTGAITLMSKMALLLGRDITERVFVKRFAELCDNSSGTVRKVCASHIRDFCLVVGKESFLKILLPCYLELCQDEVFGVRKTCAEIIMYVSSVCPPDLRRTTLTPAFVKLLQDSSKWVQKSAFQTLGPFISTFADPPITYIVCNSHREVAFVNKEGDEFLLNCPIMSDVRFCKYLTKPPMMLPFQQEIDDSSPEDESKITFESKIFGNVSVQLEDENNSFEMDPSFSFGSETDIKVMVETVKNAGLCCRKVEPEQGVIGDNLKNNLSNPNVISNIKNTTCDNLGSTIMELSEGIETLNVQASSTFNEHFTNNNDRTEQIESGEAVKDETNANNQVILNAESANEDDFNSYNYWYISPDMPLDPTIVGLPQNEIDDTNLRTELDDLYYKVLYSDKSLERGKLESTFVIDSDTSLELKELSLEAIIDQDKVPQVLIQHFLLMTDSSFAIIIDDEMAYHCAYSLPAVAMTLGNSSWPILKKTIENLAFAKAYKVRRTVASSLHELAFILGRDIATDHLTPIFENFLSDLDEVRIGILQHLAVFLKIIKPAKRLTYLPRLVQFLNTENNSNWRFRHECAQQMLQIVTLFKPENSAKYIGFMAQVLLTQDVAANREVAVSLVTELLRHISIKPDLTSHYLVRLVERVAHSKMWKCRQTFALLCNKILGTDAIPPEQFDLELMPHLLDLSWDPVANVRLVVAKTIAQNVISNEYFSNPSHPHFDSLGTVIRRLQADKDRDVRQNAEVCDRIKHCSSPLPFLDYNID